MGAAGRDFFNFNTFFRDNPDYKVVCFTAAQIPWIAGRRYPPELAGKLYPRGIPIFPEEKLPKLIKKFKADIVVLAYSDLLFGEAMQRASTALAAGCDFWLLGPNSTMLKSKKPVIAVTAVRTGAGKTTVARGMCKVLREKNRRVVVIRHPMPYGDLRRQTVQRFADFEDIEEQECSIEEREEYEQYIRDGFVVYSGIEFAEVLKRAEQEADIIVYEGGNNDLPFIKPTLCVCVVDPFRPGHEMYSYPGYANLLMADVVVINKVNTAPKENVRIVERNVKKVNKKAMLIKLPSLISVDKRELMKGKALVIEDGPTVTHGGLKFGVGLLAAKEYGVKVINPRPFAVGSIKRAVEQFGLNVVPALGYKKTQIKELERTIQKVPCDVVILGTPSDLSKFVRFDKPVIRVSYECEYRKLRKALTRFV